MRLICRLMQRLSVRHRSQGQVRGIAAQDSKLKIKEQHTTGKSHLKNRWDFLGVRLAAHVSNGLKSQIHPVVGRI